jgi:hypothetical protein
MWHRRVAQRVLVAKPEVRRLSRKLRRRWQDNIKMDLQGAWNGLIWLRIGAGGSLL